MSLQLNTLRLIDKMSSISKGLQDALAGISEAESELKYQLRQVDIIKNKLEQELENDS